MADWRIATWLAGHGGISKALAEALLLDQQVDAANELSFARGMD